MNRMKRIPRIGRVAAAAAFSAMAGIAARDALQREHTVLRNFPLIGHARYLLETVGPELRQYLVASNNEERPFTRDQRRWVYASAKKQNNYFGFGTDNDIEYTPGYPVIKHRTFGRAIPPSSPAAGHEVELPSAKQLGGSRGRRMAFRPASVVNISAMSFGSLSGPAVEALNRGAALAGCLQNTGEGGVSPYHRNGGELIFQIGTAYFGCRDEDGRFSLDRLLDLVAGAPIRALEIKLSQGAKPGLGGVLPGAKVSAEIAATRGVTEGKDCISPSRHAEFSDPDSLLDWVELLAAETGLPVGIKSAVGDLQFWEELTTLMAGGGRGVDFVTIDGGEGGTGAAPLIFTDSVSLPFQLGFARVYKTFAEHGLHEDVTFIGAGKLGLPDNAVVAFALGCDMVNVAREAMLAIGCVQAQKCHTDTCPDRGRDAERLARSRPGPRPEIGPHGQLHQDAAPGPGEGRRSMRRGAPRTHLHRFGGDTRRPNRLHTAIRRVRIRTGLGTSLSHRPSRDHRIHDRHRNPRWDRTTLPHCRQPKRLAVSRMDTGCPAK